MLDGWFLNIKKKKKILAYDVDIICNQTRWLNELSCVGVGSGGVGLWVMGMV